MNHRQLLAATAITLLSATAAQAAELYGTASLGRSDWKVDDEPGISIDKTGTGFKLGLGAQLTPNLAVEGGYVSLGKARLSGAGGSGSVKGQGVFADLVGSLPINSEVALFAKLGVFHGKAKASASGISESDSGTDAKFGFGASYALSKTTQLRAEWERYRFNLSGDKGDVDLLSVGLNFAF
ncbi:MAG: porin family protein [Burkholderiaceae bacterium]|nr:porin family protein [Burkholderiaceae bacterium]